MSKIKIVTDSGANLSPEEIQKYDITVIPLSYHQNGQLFSEEWHEPQIGSDTYPYYIQPPVHYFSKIYKKIAEQGVKHIISIHTSSSLLGIVKAAQYGKSLSHAPVMIIDSETVDVRLGQIILATAQEVEQGASIRAILRRINEKIVCGSTYFFLPHSRYILKNESLSKRLGIQNFSLSDEKLLFHLQRGKLQVLAKSQHNRKIENVARLLLKNESTSKKIFLSTMIGKQEVKKYDAFFRGSCKGQIYHHQARPFLASIIGQDGICVSVCR